MVFLNLLLVIGIPYFLASFGASCFAFREQPYEGVPHIIPRLTDKRRSSIAIQKLSSRQAMYINKAQLAHILLERSRIQGLSKHISKLTFRRNMRQENETFMNLDSNQMTIHLNVLCSFMKRGILCKLNCRFIIRKSVKRNKNGEMKIITKILYPM